MKVSGVRPSASLQDAAAEMLEEAQDTTEGLKTQVRLCICIMPSLSGVCTQVACSLQLAVSCLEPNAVLFFPLPEDKFTWDTRRQAWHIRDWAFTVFSTPLRWSCCYLGWGGAATV